MFTSPVQICVAHAEIWGWCPSLWPIIRKGWLGNHDLTEKSKIGTRMILTKYIRRRQMVPNRILIFVYQIKTVYRMLWGQVQNSSKTMRVFVNTPTAPSCGQRQHYNKTSHKKTLSVFKLNKCSTFCCRKWKCGWLQTYWNSWINVCLLETRSSRRWRGGAVQ